MNVPSFVMRQLSGRMGVFKAGGSPQCSSASVHPQTAQTIPSAPAVIELQNLGLENPGAPLLPLLRPSPPPLPPLKCVAPAREDHGFNAIDNEHDL